MKIDCNPNPLAFGGIFTRFIEAINVANSQINLTKFEVNPTLNPQEWNFKITISGGRTWFSLLKKAAGVWSQQTTTMSYMTQAEVTPFRDVRVFVIELINTGMIDIKIDY